MDRQGSASVPRLFAGGGQLICPHDAHTVFLIITRSLAKSLISCGERAGDRTQDPVIKSHVLYRLSYALGFSEIRAQARIGFPRDYALARAV